MSWLDSLAEEKDTENQSALIKFTDALPAPGVLTNVAQGLKGIPKGVIDAADTADAAFTAVGDKIRFTPRSEEEKQAEQTALENVRAIDRETFGIDPSTVGAAGQVLFGAGKIIPRTIVGTAMGGPLGGAVAAGAPEGFASRNDAIAEGIDPGTANKKGVIDAVATGVGALLPGGHVVKSMLPDFLLTVGANAGLNAAGRYADHKLLASAGYQAQAEQYKALDAQAMITDAVLGAAFFAVARTVGPAPTKTEVNAALTANQAHHQQVDSAPGIPADPRSAQLHVSTLEAAVRQALRGEPVSVADTIAEADFVNKPASPPPVAAIRAFDPGVDSITAAVDRIIALESGGRADAKNPLSSATGAGQFIDSTWLSMIRANRPDLAAGKTEQQILALRADPALSRQMTERFAEQNAQALRGAGLPDTAANLYLAHHFGADGAAKLLQADPGAAVDSLLSKKTLAANPTYRGKTVTQLLAGFERRARRDGIEAATFDPPAALTSVRAELDALPEVPAASREGLARQYEQAAAVKPKLDAAVQEIADAIATPHNPLIPKALKSPARAAEKVMADYGGDASRLRDLARATIVVDSLSQAQAAVEGIRAKFGEPSKLRNTLQEDVPPTSPDGYRDVNTNVVIDGHTVEIQVNLPQMIAAKKAAHGLYQRTRSIEARAAREGRATTDAEEAQIAALQGKQREIYDAAWSALTRDEPGPSKGEGAPATQARKSSSDINDPLRPNELDGNVRPPSTSQAVQRNVGARVTGTSSTSANSVPAGKDSGNVGALSTAGIVRESGLDGKVKPEDPVVAAAQQATQEAPDLSVAIDDGVALSAGEALAQADTEVAKAQTDAQGFVAAITCYMRTLA